MKLVCIDVKAGRVAVYEKASKWVKPSLVQAMNTVSFPIKAELENEFSEAVRKLAA